MVDPTQEKGKQEKEQEIEQQQQQQDDEKRYCISVSDPKITLKFETNINEQHKRQKRC